MNGQLTLIPTEPRLTDRQAFALNHVLHAGPDGVTADEIGALWCAQKGIHSPDDRCVHDGQSGQQLLRSLEAKGLVRYRRARGQRPGGWFATGTDPEPDTAAADASFGEFLEGY